MHAQELDAITQRAWQAVYKGNVIDGESHIK